MTQQTLVNRVLVGRTLRYALVLLVFVGSMIAFQLSKTDHTEAATSSYINFQARLKQSSGAIVPDGYYNVQLKLYNASSGGSALWTETYYDSNGATAGNDNRVRVVNGYLTVSLGSQTAFPALNWDQEMWITMNIGGTTQTASPTWDGEMNPRLRLTAVPYAFQAASASKLQQAISSYTGTLQFSSLTGNRTINAPDESGTICLQGSSNCNFAAASGSSNYIQNGTSPQTADFNITGSGNAGTSLTVGGTAVTLSQLGTITLAESTSKISFTWQSSTSSTILESYQIAESQPTFKLQSGGTLEWGPGGSTAVDTNLYRSAAGVLQTDGAFRVSGVLQADAFAAITGDNGKNTLQLSNTGTDIGITIGGDTNLYRSGTGILKTDGEFRTNSDITVAEGNAGGQVRIGAYSGNPGLTFGTSYDTNLYRAEANVLQTDDDFVVGQALTVSGTTTLSDTLQVVGSAYVQGSAEVASTLNTPFGGFGSYSNLLTYSEQLDNAIWARTNVAAITPDTILAPNGTTTAESLTSTANNGVLSYVPTMAVTDTTYTFSVWLRSDSGSHTAGLKIDSQSGANGTANNFTVTDKWQRYSVTQTMTTPTFNGNLRLRIYPGGFGTGTTGTVYAWGAQLEIASTAGPYVPVGGASMSTARTGLTVNSQALLKGSSNSTTAFQIQNAAGTSIFNVDSTNATISIDDGGGVTGNSAIRFNENRASFGYNGTNQNAYIQGSSGKGIEFITDGSANLALLLDVDGSAIFRNNTDSFNAFRIQNAAGDNLFAVNTTDDLVQVNADHTWINPGANATNTFTVSKQGGDPVLNVDTLNGRLGLNTWLPQTALHLNGNGQRIAFGEYTAGVDEDVFIGEYNNTDSDILHLQAEQGFRFTSGDTANNLLMSINAFGHTTINNIQNSTAGFLVSNQNDGTTFKVDTVNGQVVLGDDEEVNGKLTFANSTNTNTVSVVSGPTTANYTLTLPTTIGTEGQCLKLADGTGTLEFADCGSGGSSTATPRVRASNSSSVSLPNTTYTYLPFDTEAYDTDNIHSLSTNTTRFTAQTAGTYDIKGNVQFSSNGTGSYRWVRVIVNGVTVATTSNGPPSAGAQTHVNVATTIALNPGDYVELSAYQDSGSALSILSGSWMSMERVDGAGSGGTGGSVPTVKADHTGSQNIPNATHTALAMTSESYDTDNMHDNATNNSRLTINTAGTYTITGQMQFANSTTGNWRLASIRVNGSTIVAQDNGYNGYNSVTAVNVSIALKLSAGDYVELVGYQDAGGPLAITFVSLSAAKLDGGLGGTLQGAYDSGNLLTTTDARDLKVTLANTTTDANLTVDIASGSTGQFQIQANGQNTFTINGTGQAIFKNSTNSTTAFQIQNSTGSSLLTADTTNKKIILGADTSLVLGSSAAAPSSPVNGQMYYDTTLNQFRFYQNGAWSTLGSGGGGSSTATPYARVYNSTATSIPNNARTILSFNSETDDTDAIHDLTTNTSRLTAKTSGFYTVRASVNWAGPNTSGVRFASILKNGTDYIGERQLPGTNSNPMGQSVEVSVYLAAGDYVEAEVYQNSGGALNLYAGTAGNSAQHFSMVKEDGAGTGGTGGSVPAVRLVNSTSQSIGSTYNTLTFDTETYDTDSMHDAINPSRITFNTAGIYVVSYSICTTAYTSGSGVYISADIIRNGSAGLHSTDSIPGSGGGTCASGSTTYRFNAGDYATLQVNNYIGGYSVTAAFSAAKLDGGLGGTLQGSYDSGNILTTTDARDVKINLANTTTDASLTVNIASGSTGQFQIQANNQNTFWINGTGQAVFKNSTDSQYAFQIQNAAGSDLFRVDTEENEIQIAGDTELQFGASSYIAENTSGDGSFYIRQSDTTKNLMLQTATLGVQDPSNAWAWTFWIENGGQAGFQNAVNSTTAFTIQNDADDILFNVNTEDALVQVAGTGTNSAGGRLTFGDYGSTNQNVWVGEYSGDSDTLQLQGKWGVALTDGATAQNVVAVFYTDTVDDAAEMLLGADAANSSIKLQRSGSDTWKMGTDDGTQCGYGGLSGMFYLYTYAGGCAMSTSYSGETTFISDTSSIAFRIQNASGVTLLGVDSVNSRIFSGVANSSTARGFTFNTPSYTTTGAKLVSVQNNGSEKFSIDKDGNVNGLNFSGNQFNAGSAQFTGDRISFSSGQYYVLNGSSVGVRLSSGATSWSSQSDARLKDILEPMEGSVDKLNQINSVIYRFKTDDSSVRRVGVIAQDVQAVLPEAVSTDENGYLSVRYTELIPLTIAGIQELDQRLTTVEGNTLLQGGTADVSALNVSGAATIETLHVTGDATFDGDIIVNGHIIAKGMTPEVEAQTAAGTDAIVTIEGNDIAGTITIQAGQNPTAGDLAKLIFKKEYGNAPKVIVSPANDDAADLQVYRGATATDSIIFKTKDMPQAGKTYQYDYFIAETVVISQ